MAERRPRGEKVVPADGTLVGGLKAAALPGATDPAVQPAPAAAKAPRREPPKGGQRPSVDTVSGPRQARGGQAQAGAPAGDQAPARARAPRQDPREPQDPALATAILRPDMQHPGDYITHINRRRDVIHVRVIGAKHIPANALDRQRTIRIIEQPIPVAGRRGEFTARAVIDGDTVDRAAIERLERIPATLWLGEQGNTNAASVTRVDDEYFQVGESMPDGRAVRIRSLFGWKPKEHAGTGVLAIDKIPYAVVAGGEGATSYETIPLWESTMLSTYAQLLDVLMRYRGVIAAYQDPASFKFANGSELPWTDTNLSEQRKAIAEVLYEAVARSVEVMGAGATSSDTLPDDSRLYSLGQSIRSLESVCLELSVNTREALPTQHSPIATAALRSFPERSKLVTDLLPLFQAVAEGKAIISEGDLEAAVRGLDKGLMTLSDPQIAQYLRGAEYFATFQHTLESVRVDGRPVVISPESHFVVRGKLEGIGGTAKLVDVSDNLQKNVRIPGVRVVYEGSEYRVVFDTDKDLAVADAELQRARADARKGTIPDITIPVDRISYSMDAFVEMIRKDEIGVEPPRDGTKFERTIRLLAAATAEEAVGYFNDHTVGVQFPTIYREVRNANRTADGRVAYELIRGMLNTKLTEWVNTLLASEGVNVDAVRIAELQRDHDATTVEVDVMVSGATIATVPLTGDAGRDQRALQASVALVREKRAGAEKAQKEARTQLLYTFIDSANLDRVIAYVMGDEVLTNPHIPEELRSYKKAQGDAEVRAMLLGKIFDRIRLIARLPDEVRLDIASRDPFTLTVSFGEGKTEHMAVTGMPAHDRPEFARVNMAIQLEMTRLEGVAQEAPTKAFYSFIDSAPLDLVLAYIDGDDITNLTIPAPLRSFITAFRDTTFGAQVNTRITDRIRGIARIPVEAALTIAGRNPLRLTVSFGEGKTELMTVTGNGAQDTAEFRRVNALIAAEQARLEAAQRAEPTRVLYDFLDRGDIVDVIEYVDGEPLTEPGVPPGLAVFRPALRDPQAGATIGEKVYARIREYVGLPEDASIRIVGTNPCTLAVSGAAGDIARIPLTGNRHTDTQSFEALQRATEAEAERVAREVTPEALLTRFNENWVRDIVPPIRLGERFVTRDEYVIHGVPARTVFELTTLSGSLFDIQFTLTRIGAGVATTRDMEAYEFGDLVRSGGFERARFAPERAFVERAEAVYNEARAGELLTAGDVISVAGVPRVSISGKDIYRFQLGSGIRTEPDAQGRVCELSGDGTTYRITGKSDRDQTFLVVAEGSDGVVPADATATHLPYSVVLSDPQLFEVPESNFYLELSHALHIPSPELTRELFASTSGTFEIVSTITVEEQRGNATVPVEKKVATQLTRLAIRGTGNMQTITYTKSGSATRHEMPAQAFLDGIEAGTVRIAGPRTASVDTRVNKIVSVIDKPLPQGEEARLRFDARVRSVTGESALNVENALHSRYFFFVPEDGSRDAAITVTNADWTEGVLTIQYGRSAEHSITVDAFASALSSGAFRYQDPYAPLPPRPTPAPAPVAPSWDDDSSPFGRRSVNPDEDTDRRSPDAPPLASERIDGRPTREEMEILTRDFDLNDRLADRVRAQKASVKFTDRIPFTVGAQKYAALVERRMNQNNLLEAYDDGDLYDQVKPIVDQANAAMTTAIQAYAALFNPNTLL